MIRLYQWACERIYHEFAQEYDLVSYLVSAGQWRRWQSSGWPHLHGTEILEIGFGTGAMIAAGAKRGLRMTGLDRSPEMNVIAALRIGHLQCNASLVLGDGQSLPFASGTFDSVLATFPASYILDEQTLDGVRRLMRKDGRLVIVGLWVDFAWGLIGQMVPVFYGRPSKETLALVEARFAAAGFHARWVEEKIGWFTVGIVIGEVDRR